ncbi:MAG: hypothetical protein IT324_09525 [Anaerolineae bacterium]|nr:hypothetical protein [Anaerolineae bacterium]
MPYLLPVAHGALGNLDELLPIIAVAGFALVLVVMGFISRSRGEDAPPTDEAPSTPEQSPDHAADHYRLD